MKKKEKGIKGTAMAFWAAVLAIALTFNLSIVAKSRAGDLIYRDFGIAVDHGGSCDSATSVILNSDTIIIDRHISGTISSSTDRDYFEIRSPRSGQLTVWTTGEVDTYGCLKDRYCDVLRCNDDGGNGPNFRISSSVVADTYYVSVRGYNRYDTNGTGNYTLYVRFSGYSQPRGSEKYTPPPTIELPPVQFNRPGCPSY